MIKYCQEILRTIGSICLAVLFANGANAAPAVCGGTVVVTNYVSNSVGGYVLGASAALQKTPGSQTAASDGPISVVPSKDSRFVFVICDDGDSVSSFKVLQAGKLKLVSTADCFGLPCSMRVHPSGALLYVVNSGSGIISKYLIEKDGSLKLLLPSVTSGIQPFDIAFSPDGRYAYVANGKDNSVSEFVVNWDGKLLPMPISSVPVGTVPQSLCVDSTGRYLLVVSNGDNTISSLPIAMDGSISSAAANTVKVGWGPTNVIEIAPAEFCVCNLFDGNFSLVGLENSGKLGVNQTVPCGFNDGPEGAAVDLKDHVLFLASESNDTVLEYEIGPDGKSVKLLGSAKTGHRPCSVAFVSSPQAP